MANKLKDSKMSKGWTEERKLAQASNIRRTEPWKHSTGPKSKEGKTRVSKNALKHGLRGGVFRQATRVLSQNNKILKELT